jgi:hypothetical protein
MKFQLARFRLLIFLGILFVLNTLFSLFLVAFISKVFAFSSGIKTLIFAGIWGVMPLFIVTQMGKRFWGWPSWPYIGATVLLGSVSIAVGMIAIGYFLIFLLTLTVLPKKSTC